MGISKMNMPRQRERAAVSALEPAAQEEKVQVNLRLNSETAKRLRVAAAETGRTQAQIVEDALASALGD